MSRSRFIKSLKFTFLSALVLIALAGSLRAQTHYTVTHLGLGIAQAINNRGQVTGEHDPATGIGTGGAFIYFNGQLQDLPSIYGGTPTSGNAINDHGQVAGVAHPYDEYIWLFTAGHMKNLGVGYPLSINNLGTIVGYKYAGRDSDNNVLFRAVISYNGGPLQVLRNMENFNGVAIGINNLNQVVGNSIYGQVAFIWQNGQVTYLPRIDSVSDYIEPFAINNRGHIAGFGDVGGFNHIHAFLYINGKYTIFTGKGVFSEAEAINSHDQMVGTDEFLPDGSSHAALFVAGQTYDLNDLIPADSGWVLQYAHGINDSGQIVGEGSYKSDWRAHAFLLTPDYGSKIAP